MNQNLISLGVNSYMGVFRCINGCGKTIGTFIKDEDYNRIPKYNKRYSGYGQLCHDCLRERICRRFDEINVKWLSFVKYHKDMSTEELIKILNELGSNELKKVLLGTRLW